MQKYTFFGIAAIVIAFIGTALYFGVFGGAHIFVDEKSEPVLPVVISEVPAGEEEKEPPSTSEPVSKTQLPVESKFKDSNLPPPSKPAIAPPLKESAVEAVPEETKPKLHTVYIKNSVFVPRIITITVGDTVRWVNNDDKLHWPSADPHPTHSALPEFDPLSDLSPGESYAFTFTQVGAVPYHDHTQAIIDDVATITGTIVVVASQ